MYFPTENHKDSSNIQPNHQHPGERTHWTIETDIKGGGGGSRDGVHSYQTFTISLKIEHTLFLKFNFNWQSRSCDEEDSEIKKKDIAILSVT